MPFVAACAKLVLAAVVFTVAAVSGATAEDAEDGDNHCVCRIVLPVADSTAQIGVIKAMLGGTAAWFHGAAPFPAAVNYPISLGILPLTTGAGTSLIVLLGQTCELQLPPFSDLYVEEQEGGWCPFALKSKSPPPPSNEEAGPGPGQGAAALIVPAFTLPLLLLGDHDDGSSKSK